MLLLGRGLLLLVLAIACDSRRSAPVVAGTIDIPGPVRLTALAASEDRVVVATSSRNGSTVRVADLAPNGSIGNVRAADAPAGVSAAFVGAETVYLAVAEPSAELQRLRFGPAELAWIEPVFNFPGNARILALHARGSSVYAGTAVDPSRPELLVLDTAREPGSAPLRSLEVGAAVTAIRTRDDLLYVETPGSLRAFDRRSLRPLSEARLDGDPLPTAVAAAARGSVLAHLSFPPRYLVVAEGPQHGLKLHSIVDRAPLSLPDANGDGDTVLACLGDSNTAVNPSTTTKWCELLQALVDEPRFRIVNFARGGATAIRSREPSGYDQLPQAIAAGADAIVLAFGTNDTNRENKADPDAVLRAYRELSAAAEREGIEVFVATTPPRYDLDDAPIRALNQRLRDELPADRLIDFDSIVDAEDFAGGGLHLLRSGQLKRARSAYRALTAGNRRP